MKNISADINNMQPSELIEYLEGGTTYADGGEIKNNIEQLKKLPSSHRFIYVKDFSDERLKSIADKLDIPYEEHDDMQSRVIRYFDEEYADGGATEKPLRIKDNPSIVEKIQATLNEWCKNFILIGRPAETPRFSQISFWKYDKWNLFSTQNEELFYYIENLTKEEIRYLLKIDLRYREGSNRIWNQYKEIRTEFLLKYYPTIDAFEQGGEVENYIDIYSFDGGGAITDVIEGDMVTFEANGKDIQRKVSEVRKRGSNTSIMIQVGKDEFIEIDINDIKKVKRKASPFYIMTEKLPYSKEVANYIIDKTGKLALWFGNSIFDWTENISEDTSFNAGDYMDIVRLGGGDLQYQDLKVFQQVYDEKITSINDWINNPYTPTQNLQKMSFLQALNEQKEWHENLQASGGDINYKEPSENIVLTTYEPNNYGKYYYWVSIPSNSCNVESKRMGHCGTGSSDETLISLRSYTPMDAKTYKVDSHVTIAYNEDGKFTQTKGKRNNKISEVYYPYVVDLIKVKLSDTSQQEAIQQLEKEKDDLPKRASRVIDNIETQFYPNQADTYRTIPDNISSKIEEFARGDAKEGINNLRSSILNRSGIAIKLSKKIKNAFNEAGGTLDENEQQEFLLEAQAFQNKLSSLKDNLTGSLQSIDDLSKQGELLDKKIRRLKLKFSGFTGSGYMSDLDFGWDDMTSEQIQELYDIKPELFETFQGKIILQKNGVNTEGLKNQDIVIEISKISDLDNYIDINKFYVDSLNDGYIGEDNYSYYYENFENYLDELNDKNYRDLRKYIMDVTNMSEQELEDYEEESGAIGTNKGVANLIDEIEELESVKRLIARSLSDSYSSGFINEIRKEIENALEEYGKVETSADKEYVITTDYSNLEDVFGDDEVSNTANDLDDDATMDDLFEELVGQYRFEKPKVRIDDRFDPYTDINESFDINEIENV